MADIKSLISLILFDFIIVLLSIFVVTVNITKVVHTMLLEISCQLFFSVAVFFAK